MKTLDELAVQDTVAFTDFPFIVVQTKREGFSGTQRGSQVYKYEDNAIFPIKLDNTKAKGDEIVGAPVVQYDAGRKLLSHVEADKGDKYSGYRRETEEDVEALDEDLARKFLGAFNKYATTHYRHSVYNKFIVGEVEVREFFTEPVTP